jgi:hypothetical protein
MATSVPLKLYIKISQNKDVYNNDNSMILLKASDMRSGEMGLCQTEKIC